MRRAGRGGSAGFSPALVTMPAEANPWGEPWLRGSGVSRRCLGYSPKAAFNGERGLSPRCEGSWVSPQRAVLGLGWEGPRKSVERGQSKGLGAGSWKLRKQGHCSWPRSPLQGQCQMLPRGSSHSPSPAFPPARSSTWPPHLASHPSHTSLQHPVPLARARIFQGIFPASPHGNDRERQRGAEQETSSDGALQQD